MPDISLQPARGLSPARPFGAVLTAMATPFDADGEVDLGAAGALAAYLVDHGCDGLVVNGTTGESPTTSDDEKDRVLRAVLEAVGDRAHVVTGVGTNDTRHTIELARTAEKSGAHGLIVVTPYYSKPPQAGLLHHFRSVADATGLPVMLYDIPGRSGVPIRTETLIELGQHERIVAVKDAKDDLFESSKVMAATDLAYYSGTDELTLAHLTQGGSGVVGVTSHLASDEYAAMVAAVDLGDLPTAVSVHHRLLALTAAVMKVTQGVIMAKAGLQLRGVLAHRTVRPPLVPATEEQVELLRAALDDLDAHASGVERIHQHSA